MRPSDTATSATVPSGLTSRWAISGIDAGPITRSSSRGTPGGLEPLGQSQGELLVGVRQPARPVQHRHDHRLIRLVGPALPDQFRRAAALRAGGQHPRLALGRQPGQIGGEHADDHGGHQPDGHNPAGIATHNRPNGVQRHLSSTPGTGAPGSRWIWASTLKTFKDQLRGLMLVLPGPRPQVERDIRSPSKPTKQPALLASRYRISRAQDNLGSLVKMIRTNDSLLYKPFSPEIKPTDISLASAHLSTGHGKVPGILDTSRVPSQRRIAGIQELPGSLEIATDSRE